MKEHWETVFPLYQQAGRIRPGVTTAEQYGQQIVREAGAAQQKWGFKDKDNWAGLSIYRRAAAVNLERVYDSAFSHGSIVSHSGIGSLMATCEHGPDGRTMVIGPRMPDTVGSLFFASWFYLLLIRLLVEFHKLGMSQEMAKIEGQFWAVYERAEKANSATEHVP